MLSISVQSFNNFLALSSRIACFSDSEKFKASTLFIG